MPMPAPVPLPSPSETNLRPPDAGEAATLARGITSAVAAGQGLTPLQQVLLSAVFTSMTGHSVDPAAAAPIGAAEFARSLARRDLAFRTRIVQVMLLAALVLHPLPPEVAQRVEDFAAALGVDDDMIRVAEAYASGALDVAAADFARNGYLASLDPGRLRALHASALAQPWATVDADAGLAARWVSLAELPVGTLGRGVADFYTDRGFTYPGLPGSAPPLLAQHDWVHVLAGYGTALENELEVFAFIARANDDPRAFSLLAMIISLFETGYLAAGAGLFEANPGHLATEGMASRLADAMRRGAMVHGSQDFLGLDWFTVADRPIAVVRQELGVTGKDLPRGVTSPGPWETGGITEYQLGMARSHAAASGAEYVPWRPDPARA
jgi:hypothetical protein